MVEHMRRCLEMSLDEIPRGHPSVNVNDANDRKSE